MNDLTFEYYWKQLPVWRYVCVTDVFNNYKIMVSFVFEYHAHYLQHSISIE